MKVIGEVPNCEEESPLNVSAKQIPNYVSHKEVTSGYLFPKSTKESKIWSFLEKMKIYQVFPSEINVVKDVLLKKNKSGSLKKL